MVFPARPQLSSLGPQRGPGSADWEEHGFKVGGTFPGQSWPWRERGLLPAPRGHAGRLRGAAGGGVENVQPPLRRRWLQKPGLSVVPMQTLARATLPWEERQEKEKVAGGERNRRSPAGGSLGTGRPSRWWRGAVDRLPDQKEEENDGRRRFRCLTFGTFAAQRTPLEVSVEQSADCHVRREAPRASAPPAS